MACSINAAIVTPCRRRSVSSLRRWSVDISVETCFRFDMRRTIKIHRKDAKGKSRIFANYLDDDCKSLSFLRLKIFGLWRSFLAHTFRMSYIYGVGNGACERMETRR